MNPFHLLVSVVSLTVLVPFSAQKQHYSDCSPNHHFVQISDVIIVPLQPGPGDAYHIKTFFSIYKTITTATLHVRVDFQFHGIALNVTIMDEYFNFCDFWADSMQPAHCPISPGKYHMSYNGTIPKLFESTLYFGKVVLNNEKNQLLSCGTLSFNIK